MNAHLIGFIWWSAVMFLLGSLCGMAVAWKRYRNAIEDRDAQAKREAEKVAGLMAKGVKFNQQIIDILRVLNAMPRQVTIDWTLLIQAANGAGFTLVKAEPRATERVN